jgi:alpha-beta hydrolase superfamily lysophospholipase
MNLVNRHGQKLDHHFHESPAPLDPKHVIIIGHGLTANLDRPFLKALAEGLADSGFHALRLSWSGNGRSEGDFRESCISREVEDLGSVIDTITEAGYTVSYAGHSMGGAVGTLRAATDTRLRYVISLAGMVEAARFVEAEFGNVTPDAGFMWDEPDFPLSSAFVNDLRRIGSTTAEAQKIAVPYLLLHGTQDDLVPVEDARALFKTGAGNPGALVEMETDHVFSGGGTQTMVSEVIHWLKSHRS